MFSIFVNVPTTTITTTTTTTPTTTTPDMPASTTAKGQDNAEDEVR